MKTFLKLLEEGKKVGLGRNFHLPTNASDHGLVLVPRRARTYVANGSPVVTLLETA